jgi:hypothetical protein
VTGAQQTPQAPAVGDLVRVRGQQWRVLHVQTANTPSGPHHGLALWSLAPGQSGEILGVVWQTETEAQILTPPTETGPDAPAGNELLSDVTACAQHADPYLADATDIVHLPPSTLPTSASGPVPAHGDRVQVDGRAWEVRDVQTTEAGGHEATLFADNPDDTTRRHAPGDLTTVTWQPAPAPTGQDRDHLAAAHTYTWVPTPAEQDAIDWAHTHAAEHLTGPSPRQTLDLVDHYLDLADDLAAEQAADLDAAADLGL